MPARRLQARTCCTSTSARPESGSGRNSRYLLVIAFLDPSQTGAIGAKPSQARSSSGYNAFLLPGSIGAHDRQPLRGTAIQIHSPEDIAAGQKNGPAVKRPVDRDSVSVPGSLLRVPVAKLCRYQTGFRLAGSVTAKRTDWPSGETGWPAK